MKNSIKKIISLIMCAVMLLATGAVAANAATYENPVFELVVTNETSSEVTVSLNLLSGKFNCADFAFIGATGYKCKAINQSSSVGAANGFGQTNIANGKVSVACMNLYSASGAFYTATFSKPAGKSYRLGDITAEFSNCSILEDGNTIVLFPQVRSAVNIELSKTDVAMNYKDSTNIEYTTNAPADSQIVWTSSDNGVASVDENGNVYAAGSGEATVKCTVYDATGEFLAEQSCNVSVKYSVGQWLIIIFLLGFIWYI